MEYIKKIASVGVIIIVLMGARTGRASAFSVDELLARVAELTTQVDGLIKKIRSTSGETFLVNLQAGMKNSTEVRRLQQFLIEKGYLARGYDTGNFLSLTVGAVRQFQTKEGLPVTGVFDKQARDIANRSANGFTNATATIIETDNEKNTLLIKTATSTAQVRGDTTTPKITVSPASKTGPYHIDPRPTYDIAAIERATFDAINRERQKGGLSALQWNEQLVVVARAHSSDQAGDNVKITEPDVACLYPYIRHEGFASGFRVGERLDTRNISYSMAGENLIILPVGKDLIYRSTQAAPACKEFSDTEGPTGETQDEARARIQKSLLDRLSLIVGQPKLDWVNKQWKGTDEVANEATLDWMNSPGHRHNIMTPDFQEGAIGASIVNDYIVMTQVFLKK